MQNFPCATETENTVDLHGLTVKEAVDFVENVLSARARTKYKQHGTRLDGRARKTSVTFIVGKGLHSQDGRSRLGPAVTAKLSRLGLSFVSREGVVEVSF